MSIHDVDETTYDVECDGGCNRRPERYKADSFTKLIAKLREDGWRIKREQSSGVFIHECPACASQQRTRDGW